MYRRQLKGENIRLLRLLPGNSEDPLQCHLLETSLQAALSYEALSYVWGDASITEPILCDGDTVNITTNLAHALRRLRLNTTPPQSEAQDKPTSPQQELLLNGVSSPAHFPLHGPRMLWVDALCINQRDSIEKNLQVQLMKNVYSGAARVIAWIGSGDPEIVATAVATIKHWNSLDRTRDGLHFGLDFEILEQIMREQGFQDPCGALMSHFFASPWFSRVWCVQEVVLSRDAIFVFGEEEITLRELADFSSWCAVIGSKKPMYSKWRNNFKSVESVSDRLSIHRQGLRYWGLHPLEILHIFRPLAATDARDKVYGLLCLIVVEKFLEVDYDKSVAKVYAATVLHSIYTGRDLSCLSYVEHGQIYDPHTGFPSWVPRWDIATVSSRLWFEAQLYHSMRRPPPDKDLAHQGILQLDGILFDKVIISPYMDFTIGDSIFQTENILFKSVLLEFLREVQGPQPTTTDTYHSTLLALAATLTGGKTGSYQTSRISRISNLPNSLLADFLAFARRMYPEEDISNSTEQTVGDWEAYTKIMWPSCSNRCLFRTSRDYPGLGPSCMAPGDQIVVLSGGLVPYVLRPVNNSSSEFYFMGECYVHDVMKYGQRYYSPKWDGIEEERTFRLV